MIAEFYDGKLSLASNVVNLNCKKKKKKKKKNSVSQKKATSLLNAFNCFRLISW